MGISGKLSEGQVLIEAVVAFAIVMVVLVALLQLSGRSISNSGESSRQAVATNYATEGLQWVKNQRTHGFQPLVGRCGGGCNNTSFCLNNLDWANDCTVVNISGTEYSRTLVLHSPSARELSATVTVSWVESGRTVMANQSFTFIDR